MGFGILCGDTQVEGVGVEDIAIIGYQHVFDGVVFARIEDVMQQLVAGKMNAAQAMSELMHVERDDLRERVQAMLAQKQLTAREKQEALALIGQIDKGLKDERKRLDQSHTHYAMGQLAVYEEAKDTLKRLQTQGLNLAGKFVENAMRGAGQGKGRGV